MIQTTGEYEGYVLTEEEYKKLTEENERLKAEIKKLDEGAVARFNSWDKRLGELEAENARLNEYTDSLQEQYNNDMGELEAWRNENYQYRDEIEKLNNEIRDKDQRITELESQMEKYIKNI